MRLPPSVARLLRFAMVGVVNTGAYYACYLGLITVLPYLAAHVISFTIAMAGSYFLNCYLTFATRPRWRTFLLYPLSNLTNLVLSTVGLSVAVAHFGADPRLAPLEVAVVTVPITYLVAHHIMLGPLRPARRPDDDREVVR